MTTKELHQFIEYLTQQNLVWAPHKQNDQLVISQVSNPEDVVLTNELPLHSFKKILVPPREALFSYQNGSLKAAIKAPNQVIFGLTVPDLKAVIYLDQVFAKDPYYQARCKKTLIVGHSLVPEADYQFFIEKFSEDILEHLKFDIFLAIQKNKNNFIVYTGSEDGQRILDDFGYKLYEHIEYVGPIKEDGPDKQMLEIRKKFYDNPKIWQDLAQRCIECGKCSMVCPTCFCHDIIDQPELGEGSGTRSRQWTACFYVNFSQVAGRELRSGKPKFLSNTEQRIRFWYEHKFVRSVDEFGISGCVGCGRCTKVCPVAIDIKKTLQKILKGEIE